MSQTTKSKRLFLLPHWIVTILERNGLPLTTVKDLVKLREVASPEDLVLTLMLNDMPARVLGVQDAGRILGLVPAWTSSAEALDQFQKLRDLFAVHQTGLEDRLYNEKNLDARFPKEFEIRDLDEDTFLVIIYPGHFGGADAYRHQFKLMRAYLELWYGYSNFDSVARDPLFREYLARL